MQGKRMAIGREKYFRGNMRGVTKNQEMTWTVKSIEEHFREAALTLKALPEVKQKGYFSVWPDVVYTSNEMIFQKKKLKRISATPDSIARLDKTFEWMKWVTVEERKLIWKRAENKHWKAICWELGCDRTTAWRKWVLACTKIATSLNMAKIKELSVATK